MKRLKTILAIVFATVFISCSGQGIPSIGGMQKLGVVGDAGGICDITGYTYTDSYSPTFSPTSSIEFAADGTKFYVLAHNSDKIYQYSLGTAWDISTASYDNIEKGTSPESTPNFFTIANNGETLIINGNLKAVLKYTLTTAWNLTTMGSYDNYFFVSNEMTSLRCTQLNNTGEKMYCMDVGGTIYQYSLSTAWDVSTASYDNVSGDITVSGTDPKMFSFCSDGSVVYVGYSFGEIYQYTLSTAWDITTIEDVGTLIIDDNNSSANFYINNSSANFYINYSQTDTIFQYSY